MLSTRLRPIRARQNRVVNRIKNRACKPTFKFFLISASMYEKIRVYFVISKKVTGKIVYINFVKFISIL